MVNVSPSRCSDLENTDIKETEGEIRNDTNLKTDIIQQNMYRDLKSTLHGFLHTACDDDYL